MEKKAVLSYISSFSTILISGIFFLFPVFFLTNTTDFFTFPKQLLIVSAALVLFILWSIKSVVDGKITLLLNPLNIPVFLFAIFVVVSSLISPNKLDSLLQAVPVALMALFYFAVINFINDKTSFTISLSSLIIGGVVSAAISILSELKIYILPFAISQNQFFNTQGAPIHQISFLIPLGVLCVASLIQISKNGKFAKITKDYGLLIQAVSAIIIGGGIATVVYQVFSQPQKPILLPYDHGFQIALASLSDASRLLPSFLLGSGYGTFATNFTRFVTSTFNSNSAWNLTFSFSSSYLFELIATTGLLGLTSFLFMAFQFFKSRKSFTNPLFLSVASAFILSILLPFSFSMVFLLFALLALYIAYLNIELSKKVSLVALNLVTFQQGLFSLSEDFARRKNDNYVLPLITFVASILISVLVLFYLIGTGDNPRKGYVQLYLSDIKFAKSLASQALRNGSTYILQKDAIGIYPYRSDYYRVFSQVNLAIAGNLVSAQQGNTKPSAQVQQNILGLLQQSINSARQAVTLAPTVALNWQNLSQIYRNLIGVGQNAEQFTIASLNQAVALSPSNPALRIELGGIYYQLKQYDLAQNQFQIAVQLKPDYANAHYNLGKALEQKNDLQGALQEYQTVRQLVANDKPNLDKINGEIKSVEAKIGAQAKASEANIKPSQDKSPLNVNKASAEFPPQDPKVKIPPPPVTPTPTASVTPSPTGATPSPTQSQ